MTSPQRVVWSEGMLMSPQHFQQQDRYHEAHLHERLTLVVPYGWGVSQLELDERALDAGQVAVRSFAGVLPGGTALRFRLGDAEAPMTRAIEPAHFPPNQVTLDVHVAMLAEQMGGASYAQSESERGRARYVIESRRVFDTVAPDREETVDFARRAPALLFGDEAREDYERIKVGEVVRDRAGKLRWAGSYVAPCLRVGVSRLLTEGLRSVLAATISKRRAVTEELRHRDRTTVEFAADEVGRYLALHALGGAIPLLKHLLEEEGATPYQAYLVLLQLAGQLSAFSADEDPAALPGYSHLDGRSTFAPLLEKLQHLLQVAVRSRVLSTKLEGRVDGMHLGRLQATEFLELGVRFVLGVQTQVAEHTAYELLPRVAKIASWSEIPGYLNAAVSTVSLAASTRPPREIPVRPGTLYFSVDTEGPVWRGVVHERTVALHLPPPFDAATTQVELFAIPAG